METVIVAVFLAVVLGVVPVAPGCYGLRLPNDAPVVAPFAPVGAYAGHWGIDIGIPPGTGVESAGAGVVTFAGPIGGRLSVTVDHGGGIRTSYSYLASIDVEVGALVGEGSVVGVSAVHASRAAFHFSLRVGTVYRDPGGLASCSGVPGPGLWLATRAMGML